MSAAVRIEPSSWSDGRFNTLARLLQVDRYSAVGRMAAIWAECTNRESYSLSQAFVAGVLDCDPEDAGRILESAELGSQNTDGTIRIKGTEGRIEWLADKRKNSRKGGAARAKKAGSKPEASQEEAYRLQKRSLEQAEAKPNGSPLALALVSTSSKYKKRSVARPEGSDHVRFVEHWSQAFAERYGAKPTWGAKQGKLVKQLLAQHGVDECIRRADRLLRNPPAWVTGAVDIGLLASQFDRLLEPCGAPRSREDAEWLEVPNLAEIEARMRREGKPIPWASHPLRKRMREDRLGNPLEAAS